MREQQFGVYTLVMRVGVREMLAYIAEGQSTEERVAERVDGYIGIAVAIEAEGVGYEDSAEP